MNNEIRELLKELIEESMGFNIDLVNEKKETEIKDELLKDYEERLNGILKRAYPFGKPFTGLNLCDCNKKVIADGNKGMEMGEIR